MAKRSWGEILRIEMEKCGEGLSGIVSSTLTDEDMAREFDTGFKGECEGVPFTVWTAKRVYFPMVYDGAEWVASVSRNPDGEVTEHVGGGV